MDTDFKSKLINIGLRECIPILERQEIIDLETLSSIIENNEEIIIPEKYFTTLLLLLKTLKTSNTISSLNVNDNIGSSIKVDKATSNNMRECYIKLLNDRNITPKDRQNYIYTYFILPYIDDKDTTDQTISVSYEGKRYDFNKSFISIGRGCPQYPVDIKITERNENMLSISRVNCVLVKIKHGNTYKYNLFDAWSICGTKIEKYNPYIECKTSNDNFNIIKWDSDESAYIYCGNQLCVNKIHVIADNYNNNNDPDKPICVICSEPANIRLGCGHAVYCGNNCMNSHTAYQINHDIKPVCPFCKKDNLDNKFSVCVNQYKI